MAMSSDGRTARNPGPSWGYAFLVWAERRWPRWVFRPAVMAGTWVAVAAMPAQRRHSREYLRIVLGRAPSVADVWWHFFAFTEFLMLSLRAGRGGDLHCSLAPKNADSFEALLASNRPALFGSFHFGYSDLLGYLLGGRGCKVSILRQQVENSDDTRWLGERFGRNASFLWINDPARLPFDLKEALDAGRSIAMKCDRIAFSSRTEAFEFLGARRVFPFTIYHVATLFERPVVFCIAVPGATPNSLLAHASTVFVPDPSAGTDANLAAGRAHFQEVLRLLESLVRAHPYLWFNYLAMNPVSRG